MPLQIPVNPSDATTSAPARGVFRDWLMEGHEPSGLIDGQPVALWLLERGAYDALGEAWAAGADPDALDPWGRNWLHRSIALQVPSWVALDGLRRLGRGWWAADTEGHTPFHLPVYDPRLAQAMLDRWWAEGRRWNDLTRPFDPRTAALPQSAAWRADRTRIPA